MSQALDPSTPDRIDALYDKVRGLLVDARSTARRAVNQAMVQTYWHVGRLIVEEEQGGAERAAYGQRVLESLSERLSVEFGRGFSLPNLRNFRQFYLAFGEDEIRYTSGSELSWSHFRRLMRVDNADARRWYAAEAVSQAWSVAALDRQIGTLYYERLLSSQDHQAVRDEARRRVHADAPTSPRDFIRDPYVLEFLGGQAGGPMLERSLEQALLDQLQKFLLELGKGFAFVSRQQHLRVEDEDAYVDLVFYNFILKCFVLVELKVGKLAHQDVGQMDMYVKVYDERFRREDDGPTLGIILSSERNEAVARYSQLAGSEQLFASRYRAVLPTEEELRMELQRDRAMVDPDRSAENSSGEGTP